MPLIFFVLLFGSLKAQYAPPAGQPGSTAIHKDSSVFKSWATGCKVIRGYQDISDHTLGYASAGDSSFAIGKAQVNGPVSLGDGGFAICTFSNPIVNGNGPDFAVFENGFDDHFLELAFVEVSSDGLNFFRFPSHSLTDTVIQTASFDSTDATKINNLAGKYRGGYGVPFDLSDLPSVTQLNKNAVTHVLVRDVVGSLNKSYATYDSHGNKINDPWPTAFPQGGFDLDAIGVINENTITGSQIIDNISQWKIYPNPVESNGLLYLKVPSLQFATITNAEGLKIIQSTEDKILLTGLKSGFYFLSISTENETKVMKLIIR